MNSHQPSNERKQQRLGWFSKPSSFFRFKLVKSGFLSHSRSSSSSKSQISSSLSSDPSSLSSLSRAQSPSSITITTSKDSIYAASSTGSVSKNQKTGVAYKRSSKVRQSLDAVPSSTIATVQHSSRPIPIHSTVKPQTTRTPDYRQPIPSYFANIAMVPGVCCSF